MALDFYDFTGDSGEKVYSDMTIEHSDVRSFTDYWSESGRKAWFSESRTGKHGTLHYTDENGESRTRYYKYGRDENGDTPIVFLKSIF